MAFAGTPGGESGALPRTALMELWCWLWAGIAERECRIWRELESSRDIRKEKQACVELRHLMLRRIASPGTVPGASLAYQRLCTVLPSAAAGAFEAELRGIYARAKQLATGNELDGNDHDALEVVLAGLLPTVTRLRSRDPVLAAPRDPAALAPAAAFEFHAWLTSTIEDLERGLGKQGSRASEGAEQAEVLRAYRMVLAQWVASLPPGAAGHTFQTTHAALLQGVDAERFHRFAGWLSALADQDCTERCAPSASRAAFEALARVAEVETLRALHAPPPWDAPSVLPRIYLGGDSRPGSPVTFTIVESSAGGKDRWAIPFHQFLAALERG